MKTVNMHQAKTTFSRLIEQVEAGEEITIARNGKPVAKIVRSAAPTNAEAIAQLRGAFGLRLGGIPVRDLIDEGRKY